jgi:hypothetical protein
VPDLTRPDPTRPGTHPEPTRNPPGADPELTRSQPGTDPENAPGVDPEPNRSRPRTDLEPTRKPPGADSDSTRNPPGANPKPYAYVHKHLWINSIFQLLKCHVQETIQLIFQSLTSKNCNFEPTRLWVMQTKKKNYCHRDTY